MKKFIIILALFILSIVAVSIFTEKPARIVNKERKTTVTTRKIAQSPKKIVGVPKKAPAEQKKTIEPSKLKIAEPSKKTVASEKKPFTRRFIESFNNIFKIPKKPEVPTKKKSEVPKKETVVPLAAKGEIAIVLDDWGYSLNNLKIADEIKYPVTLAILPNLPYSQKIAEEANARGWEVILHMPMEPMERYNLEKDTILTSMPEREMLRILDKDLTSIPYLVGISNHMGSKATSNSRTMTIIFKELKRRNLYFLDSFVTSKSVCSELSNKLNLREFRRDVFLDNMNDRAYIKKQMLTLKTKASKNGFAIGIGHDRTKTLEVLREVMPQLAKEGYEFVYLSDK